MILTPEQWLKRPSLFRCILVEADYLDAGVLKTLYLSNYAYRSKPTDTIANRAYKNWLNVASIFTFSQRMTIDSAKSETSTSAIEFFLDPSIENLITETDFAGQSIRVFIGAPIWSRDLFIEKFVGIAHSIEPVDDNRARISFSDYSKILAKPVLTSVVSSSDNKDVFKPKCFGQCFNIEPVLINKVTRTYQINDGPIHSVTQVRESGFIIAPANYTVDAANGTITINKNVTGRLTLDCKGHVESAAYLSTAEQIINKLLAISSVSSAIDIGVLPTYTLGLYVRNQRNVDECIDDICASVGGNWYFDSLSQFRLQQYSGVETSTGVVSAGQIKSASLRIKERLPAVSKLTIGYQKNYTPQGDGLAATITENSPELATLFQNEQSVLVDTNTVVNVSSAIELIQPTLIANSSDALTELTRRLALTVSPRTIYSMETTIKKHTQGETISVSYPRYFSSAKDAVISGQIHRLNNPTDIIEVIA